MKNDDMPTRSDAYRLGAGIMLLNAHGHVFKHQLYRDVLSEFRELCRPVASQG
jgi:hypothetical protein